MPELNHKFHAGRMNKDLDERLVPNGEYRDALNIEVNTSEGSNMGAVQTIMGNEALSNFIDMNLDFYCVGSIVNTKNDRIYWMISGQGKDIIAEYDTKAKKVNPVVVDIFPIGTPVGRSRTLNFDKSFLITGLNIIDGLLFWTDNNTEPKRIHIERCKLGTPDFQTHTELYVRDVVTGSPTVAGGNYIGSGKLLREKHITVIKKSPQSAPFIEMKPTTRSDISGNYTTEITTTLTVVGNPFLNNSSVEIIQGPVSPPNNPNGLAVLDSEADFKINDRLIFTTTGNAQTFNVRCKITNILPPVTYTAPGTPLPVTINLPKRYVLEVIAFDIDIVNEFGIFDVKLEQEEPLFKFKFPRFATRYIYEDGEYSIFSPFTEVAFLPGEFDYLNKEGYNLGMVNNVRYLAIKDFVDERLIPDDVIAIDILYKESNSPNVYSVKTIKRTTNTGSFNVHDQWNATSKDTVVPPNSTQRTKGFLEITSELIHATVPSNQLLRSYDNVPRKALAQEITGNRIVYGNYLQNYDMSNKGELLASGLQSYGSTTNYGILTAQENITTDLDLSLKVGDVGNVPTSQHNPLFAGHIAGEKGNYGPSKSIKTLRTYQVGVVYIDEYGRETPVFSDGLLNSNSITVQKSFANRSTKLAVQPKNTYPDWAKSFKFFIKETSNEYYNLAMDRWYNAEDGNIWISFPSSERNKIDEETFLILKKEHDTDIFTPNDSRYKVIAIENEAPLFVKTELRSVGSFFDDGNKLGSTASNFPLPGNNQIRFDKVAFESVGFATPSNTTTTGTSGIIEAGTEGAFYLQDYSKFKIRAKVGSDVSNFYDVQNISFSSAANGSYVVHTKVQMEQDMAITSASDGVDAFNDRFSNVEMQVFKENVENKPEYDGRFFVKIKKDINLINTIIKPSNEVATEYYITNSIKSQYISFADANAYMVDGQNAFDVNDWYGVPVIIPDPFNPGGFVHRHYEISVNGYANFEWAPGTDAAYANASYYWEKASYGDSDPNTTIRSASSGWFIDKIEGFRRSKSAWKNYAKIKPNHPDFNFSGYRTEHEDVNKNYPYIYSAGAYASVPGYAGIVNGVEWYGFGSNIDDYALFGPANQMLVEGTSTIGSKGWSWNQYLDLHDAKGPWNQLVYDYTVSGGSTTNNGVGMIGCKSQMNGPKPFEIDSGIVPSAGIHENMIHLSYSGIGLPETSGQYDDSSNNFFEYSTTVAASHVNDIEFINTITTPGSIWRWKEDPGQCVYQTMPYNPNSDPVSIYGYTINSGTIGVKAYTEATDADGYPNQGSFDYNGAPLTQDIGMWSYNTYDRTQNELGVALYNYCTIQDYPIGNPGQVLPPDYYQSSLGHLNTGSHRAGGTYMNWWHWYSNNKVIDPSNSIGVTGKSAAQANAIKFCSVVAEKDVVQAIADGDLDATGSHNDLKFMSCGGWGLGSNGDISNPSAFVDQGSTFGHNWNCSIPSQLHNHLNGGTYGKWPMFTRDWWRPSNKRRRYQFLAKSLESDPVTGERYNLGEAPASASAANPGHQHFYLPTNDPSLDPHFGSDFQPLLVVGSSGNDNAGDAYPALPTTPAPGIRPDGMHSGYNYPGGTYTITTGKDTNKSHSTIPQFKVEDGSGVISPPPGSCTWQILSRFSPYDDIQYSSTNPAIWETEPKEDVGLDIYHEVGQIYPIELNEETVEQFLGPIKNSIFGDIEQNSKVRCWTPPTGPWVNLVSGGTFSISSPYSSWGTQDIRVKSTLQQPSAITGEELTWITLHNIGDAPLSSASSSNVGPSVGDILYFTRADGSVTSTKVIEIEASTNPNEADKFALASDLHNYQVVLPFHNCYSFGNGVESDRIRDDFNQVTIDNGPKASTTLEEPYKEERRGSGLIYSGIYNSMSGINNLNQFIAAEKITKDLNPKYGTIQKLHTRNTNLLTFCEDKIFKILANKDALFNADGNSNLISTDRFLGSTTPVLGEYGISTNPESFTSRSYRAYFTDKNRGAVLRLSQDGLTIISDVAMKDYFGDVLPTANRIIGSFDVSKEEYNVTTDYFNYDVYPVRIVGSAKFANTPPYNPANYIITDCENADLMPIGGVVTGPGIPIGTTVVSKTPATGNDCYVTLSQSPTQQSVSILPPFVQVTGNTVNWNTNVSVSEITTELPNSTVSFSEISKGWTSFKSYLFESGVSLNNDYYTFKHGDLYIHNSENVNKNYFYDEQYDSSIQVLYNQDSEIVKSFQTLNYEGTQSRIIEDLNDNEYYDNIDLPGWYASYMYTDLQEGEMHGFKSKEGKWFSKIQGQTTEWVDDGTAGNIDTSEFSYQGIDELSGLEVVSGGFTSFDCLQISVMCGRRLVQLPELLAGVDVIGSGLTSAGVLWRLPAIMWCIDNAPSLPFDDFIFEVLDTVSSTTKYLYLNAQITGNNGSSSNGNDILNILNTSSQYLGMFPQGTPSSSIRTGQFYTDPVTSQVVEIYVGQSLWLTSGSLGGSCTGAITSTYQCTQIQGLGGAYPDEATCLADPNALCYPAPPSFNCNQQTGICTDPGDGTGTYSDEATCIALCSSCATPNIVSNTVDATGAASNISFSNCNNDGQVDFEVTGLGGTTWDVEVTTLGGAYIYNSGPFANNGQSTIYSFLAPGDYVATITDDLGCQYTHNFTIGCSPFIPGCSGGPYFTSTPGNSPHQFNWVITQQPICGSNTADGEIQVSNIILGNSATTFTVEYYIDVFGTITLYSQDPNTYSAGDTLTPLSNIPNAFYYFDVTDNFGCVYRYVIGPLGCIQACSTIINNVTVSEGSCSAWPMSGALSHIHNPQVIQNICTDRCEAPNEKDNQVLAQGTHTYDLGCIPTDADHVKVEYYEGGNGPVQNFIYGSTSGPGITTPLFIDPQHYTAGQVILWDTVEPSLDQMGNGPEPHVVNNVVSATPPNGVYKFFMRVVAYDAFGNILIDSNNDFCETYFEFEVPCGGPNCGSNCGGPPSYLCTLNTGGGLSDYSTLYQCLNGTPSGGPACAPVLASTYDCVAGVCTLNPSGLGTYPDLPSCQAVCVSTPITGCQGLQQFIDDQSLAVFGAPAYLISTLGQLYAGNYVSTGTFVNHTLGSSDFKTSIQNLFDPTITTSPISNPVMDEWNGYIFTTDSTIQSFNKIEDGNSGLIGDQFPNTLQFIHGPFAGDSLIGAYLNLVGLNPGSTYEARIRLHSVTVGNNSTLSNPLGNALIEVVRDGFTTPSTNQYYPTVGYVAGSSPGNATYNPDFNQAITNSSNSSIPLGTYVFNDSSSYSAAINTSPSSDIVHNFTAVNSSEVFMIQLRSDNPGLSVIIDEICISQT